MRTRLLYAAALLLAFAAPTLHGERVQDLPRPTNYVSDFAHVLSPQTQQSLNALCAQVDHRAHAQIAVVTIQTLDGEPIEDFATQLEDKWKVGPRNTDRGVLLIFAIADRKRRIEVGYGLEGILPDGKAGDIGRSMVPALRQRNYDEAITTGVQQVAQVIAADAGITLDAAPRRGPPSAAPVPLSVGGLILLGVGALILLLGLLFVLSVVARASGGNLLSFLFGMLLGRGFGGGWRNGGGGGGDFGGGGGGSDGGGFGGFDGGSSGGGGASGDW